MTIKTSHINDECWLWAEPSTQSSQQHHDYVAFWVFFYRRGNEGPERLTNLAKITQPARVQPQLESIPNDSVVSLRQVCRTWIGRLKRRIGEEKLGISCSMAQGADATRGHRSLPRGRCRWRVDSGVRHWLQILTLPSGSCVDLSKWQGFPEPYFSQQKNRDNDITCWWKDIVLIS